MSGQKPKHFWWGGMTLTLAVILTAGGCGTNETAPVPDRPEAVASASSWFERPMRWAQLTLVENDPANFDPQFWLDFFERTHCEAACLSAGGCVAYYPTDIPFHHRSAWLGDSDPLGELIEGCRRLGMTVIVRTDPHSVLQDVYEAHPDWIAVDAEGRKRQHWASPHRWVTCALGPYNFEFMTEVHKEIMSRYKVDGIFSNRWSGHGLCYCEHCVKNFKEAAGMDLPRTRDPKDPAYRQYVVWRQKRLFDLWMLWDREIRNINPEARYIPNSGGGATSSLDMKTVGELSDILFADRQARRGLAPPWIGGKNAKEFRSALGNKPVGGIFSLGVVGPHRWMDSIQYGPEIRIWVADGIANGMRPWFTKFSGTIHDHRWIKVVEEIYDWHYRNEAYLRNTDSLAEVGMVYSQQTATFYGGPDAGEKVEDHTLGFYQALIEARIPFEMVHDGLLDVGHIGRFNTLILPNIAALSEDQCRQLQDYVRHGGNLVATFETSLYDEWGDRRDNFGLSDLFKVDYTGTTEGSIQNSYLNIEQDPDTGGFHPLLSGLEGAERMINGVQWVHVDSKGDKVRSPLTLVPSYPNLPMEEVYPRFPRTDIPGVYCREINGSRIVYFPWDIDRTFWEVLHFDHALLLRNAVLWAHQGEQPVEVTGKGVLDVTVWRQKNSMTVHLVNLTNPMMMKGPFRDFFPVGEQRVRIRLPGGEKVRNVKLLSGLDGMKSRQEGDTLTVVVPSVLVHEVIAVDLEF